MGASILTTATVASCPHGGQASFTASQSAVKIEGAAALVATDTTTIDGCPFVIATVPSPCVTVQWLQPAMRVSAGGIPVLLESSIGLCLGPAAAPQGTLQISTVQSVVTAT